MRQPPKIINIHLNASKGIRILKGPMFITFDYAYTGYATNKFVEREKLRLKNIELWKKGKL